MSANHEKKEMKTKPAGARKYFSAQEESSSTGKRQVKQPETMEGFCDKIINKVKDIEPGELLAEGENLFDRARKLDKEITGNAKGLVSKVTGYFRDSVDSYKKARK